MMILHGPKSHVSSALSAFRDAQSSAHTRVGSRIEREDGDARVLVRLFLLVNEVRQLTSLP